MGLSERRLRPDDVSRDVTHFGEQPDCVSQHEPPGVYMLSEAGVRADNAYRDYCRALHLEIGVEKDGGQHIERVLIQPPQSGKLPGRAFGGNPSALDLIALAAVAGRVISRCRIAIELPAKRAGEQQLSIVARGSVGAPNDFAPSQFIPDADMQPKKFRHAESAEIRGDRDAPYARRSSSLAER